MRLRSFLVWLLPGAVALLCAPSCAVYDTSLLLDAPPTGGASGQGGSEAGGQGGSAGSEQGGGGGTDQGGAGGSDAGEGGSGGTGDAGAGGSDAGAGGSEAGAGGSDAGAGGDAGTGGSAGAGGAPECTSKATCDDGNICTTDDCVSGKCTHTSDDAAKPASVAGNCKAEKCVGGEATQVNDDSDLPTDDGDSCTVEACTDGATSTQTLADDAACKVAGKDGFCSAGKCVIECPETGCNDNNPCTTDSCQNGKCVFANQDEGLLTPGATNNPGDCKKNVCQGGKPTEVVDTSDLPATTTDCQKASCTQSGQPSLDTLPDGSPCPLDAAKLCKAGACVTNTCGDGLVAGTEECDDNNQTDTDACTNACKNAKCGDNIVGPGEECDDGNSSNNDACSTTCKATKCGDGIVQGGEECDDPTSPGAAGDGCSKYCTKEPAVGELVISEIMVNPEYLQTSQELGEWFELYNPTAKAIDVRGLQIASGTVSVLIEADAPLLVPAGGYGVFAKTDKKEDNGLSSILFVYGTGSSKPQFTNSGSDDLRIELPTSPVVVIDETTFAIGSGSTYKGNTYSLNPTKLNAVDNDTAANWCGGKTVFNSTDKGTPGAPNDACP